jgi:hypothetical protein
MRADRWLIVSFVSLVTGLWLLFAWCHGSVGLSFAHPLSGTKLAIDTTSTGGVVLIGIPLVILGALLLLIAFFASLVAQFRWSRPAPKKSEVPPPNPPSPAP